MERVLLYDEYRLIERSEAEVNAAWKGAHLLLFFLAFIFGSFCTFCFHMLMYLFDEKCVLFPKLLSLSETRHSIIYDFIPDKSTVDKMPVDFVSTKFMEKSACYLPTYLPLLSGICGLIWTAMFLMCSSGYQTLTGSQRSWRILPPIFIFSFTLGGLCIYSSAVTHAGLLQLCNKLGEITGSTTCSYTINVATLAYERRIRGVYQAVRLTIISAWLHTTCWLMSGLLALVRVLIVVDFRLVRISAELQGDVDKILEHHEEHIRTVSPDIWIRDDATNTLPTASFSSSSVRIHFQNKTFNTDPTKDAEQKASVGDHLHYYAHTSQEASSLSLVPEEEYRLERIAAYDKVPENERFLVKILHDILDSIEFPDLKISPPTDLFSMADPESETSVTFLVRNPGQSMIDHEKQGYKPPEPLDDKAAEEFATELRRHLVEKLQGHLSSAILSPSSIDVLSEGTSPDTAAAARGSPPAQSTPSSSGPSTASTLTPPTPSPSPSTYKTPLTIKSVSNITEDTEETMKKKQKKERERTDKLKSSLKHTSVQTDSHRKKLHTQKVHIVSTTSPSSSRDASQETLKPASDDDESQTDTNSKDEEPQKPKKEKQD